MTTTELQQQIDNATDEAARIRASEHLRMIRILLQIAFAVLAITGTASVCSQLWRVLG